MSRIGKLPVQIPAGVTISIKDNVITAKGPKGELKQYVDPSVVVKEEDGVLHFSPVDESKQSKANYGTYRALVNNIVVGVSEGFKKTMELIGVGFRASNQGQLLELSIGYSHPIFLMLPDEVKVETQMERNKAPIIILESADKQLLGQVCAKIRSFRKPEPYKGKGIRFQGEVIRRKSGKSVSK